MNDPAPKPKKDLTNVPFVIQSIKPARDIPVVREIDGKKVVVGMASVDSEGRIEYEVTDPETIDMILKPTTKTYLSLGPPPKN